MNESPRSRLTRFARAPLTAGALGGAVVAAIGLILISAGWIDVDDGDAVPGATVVPSSPASAGGKAGALAVDEIYQASAPGVVFVEAGRGTGSGFVVDTEGHVVTNAHVVSGGGPIEVTLEHDGEPVSADVVGTDPSTDIAVLDVEADPEDLNPLPLGRSVGVDVGDPVVAIGNPFGLDRTVTSGIVSALQRQIEAPNQFTISDVIQTDAPINPGNSGGPLLDAGGRVIGVNSQIATGGGNGSVGIGFAVPIDTVRDVTDQILEDGEVEHAYLGVTLADLDPRLARVLNLPVDSGALVQDVEQDGPADEAGIEAGRGDVTVGNARVRAGGDVIVAIDGEPVNSADDVIAAVNARQPGDDVELELIREGERTTVTIELGSRPESADPAPGQEPGLPPEIPGLPPLPGLP